MRIGELFILGFNGTILPQWLLEFEQRFGLGGVILFDYDCQTKTYDNNIKNPAQLKELCAAVSALPSRPLIFIDQEGGKVRRLKDKLGFAPLPSQQAFQKLAPEQRFAIALHSFREMRGLGIHYDLAPVIDLNVNPENPDIGAIERSYSADPLAVRESTLIVNRAAKEAGLGLCLKHYPGLGGATVNSHLELTDITGTLTAQQLALFYELAPTLSGNAVLVSHGMERSWDPYYPISMSAPALSALRARLPETLLISDDLQMQGLQKILPTREACIQGLWAGLDMLIIGNNLMAEGPLCAGIAETLEAEIRAKSGLRHTVEDSVARVKMRKTRFC